MMCHDAKRHLDLFMDGELSVPENLKVLEHLNLCRPCAGIYEGEKGLRALLRSRLGAEPAPAGLAERLASSIAAPAPLLRPEFASSRSRLFSAAAAAAFFLVGLLFVLSTPGEKPRAFAAEMATKHNETHDGFCGQQRDDCLCVCRHCSAEPKESGNSVGKFFQRQAGAGTGTCVHDLSALGYQVVGASVFRHRGQPVCWTVQRDDAGHTITHGLITTKIAMEPGPMLVCDGVDRPVVLMPREGSGMTCVFVFDDEGEAQRFRKSRKLN
jgi:anti-sigma factor (TIGR02949 family)